MEIAIEKENLVFDYNYQPVHKIAGEMPQGIELDFSDHQVEFISEPFTTSKNVVEQINSYMKSAEFNHNYFWPISMPPSNNHGFTLVGTRTTEEQNYRQLLLDRYGIDKMLISGIHINYSHCNKFNCNHRAHYFDLMKRAYVYGPILSQFVSFTPYASSNLQNKLVKHGNNYSQNQMISLRNSRDFGYCNEHKFELDYRSYEDYRASINSLIANGIIASEKELYAKIRHKGTHIELRFADINPYYSAGISDSILEFFALSLRAIEEIQIINFNNQINLENFNRVATEGLNNQIELNINNYHDTLLHHTIRLFDLIRERCQLSKDQVKMLNQLQMDYLNDNLDLHKMINEYQNEDLNNDQFGIKHLKQMF